MPSSRNRGQVWKAPDDHPRVLPIPVPMLAHRYHGWTMSEQTDRLEDLAKRIAAAKEFL